MSHPAPSHDSTTAPLPDPRSGMALVTVLGILTTLLMLVLAFAFLARSERTAASNALHRAQARHSIDVSLNIALLGAIELQTISQGAVDYDDLLEDYPSSDSDGHPLRHPLCFGSIAENDGDGFVRLGRPAITNWLPQAIWADATNTWSAWRPITSGDRRNGRSDNCTTNGRFAYLVIDCSGFLDIHGVTSNHAAILEEDFPSAPDWDTLRDEDGTNRYAFLSQPDLNARGGAWGFATPSSNLVACLFDPGPNCTVTNWSGLGERTVELVPRHNLCPWDDDDLDAHPSCLDFPGHAISLPDWLDETTNRLVICGYGGEEMLAVAWNLLNFIDRDRVPQAWDGDGNEIAGAWRRDWPVEDVPLVNEMAVLSEISTTNAADAIVTWNGPTGADDPGFANMREWWLAPDEGWTNYAYRTAVELWYPFAPRTVESGDDAGLAVAVYTNAAAMPDFGDFEDEGRFPHDASGGSAGILFGMDGDPDKDEMRGLLFDPAGDEDGDTFFVSTNPVPDKAGISFPVLVAITNFWVTTETVAGEGGTEEEVTTTNWVLEAAVRYLPLGQSEYEAYLGPSNSVPTNCVNELRMVARVSIGDGSYTNWVDEAPWFDTDLADAEGDLPVFDGATNRFCLAVDDPRKNGSAGSWEWVEDDDDDGGDTLGTTNRNCSAWFPGAAGGEGDRRYGQGLPLIHFDGRLRSAGDIGFVASTGLWQSVCLADDRWLDDGSDTGAIFTRGSVLDFFTLSPTNRPVLGMMAYSCPWTNVVRAVMADIPVSESRVSTNLVPAIAADHGEDVVGWMTDCYLEACGQEIETEDGKGRICPTTYGELAYFLSKIDRFREGPAGYGREALDNDGLWLPSTNRLDDVLKEDFLRGLSERASFRQRLYVIVLATQSLAPNGRIQADQRAIATVAADFFTGQWRILNWAWLTE